MAAIQGWTFLFKSPPIEVLRPVNLDTFNRFLTHCDLRSWITTVAKGVCARDHSAQPFPHSLTGYILCYSYVQVVGTMTLDSEGY